MEYPTCAIEYKSYIAYSDMKYMGAFYNAGRIIQSSNVTGS